MRYLSLLLLVILPSCARFEAAVQAQADRLALRHRPTPRSESMAHYLAAVMHERRGRFDEDRKSVV